MSKDELLLLEKDVIRWILDGQDPVLESLRQQFSVATIGPREKTGVGIYLNLEIPITTRGVDALFGTRSRFCIGDVGAKIGAHHQEVGFLLWILEGRLSFLEGYSYGSEQWPEELTEYHLFYFGGNHDLDELKNNWVA